MIEKTMSDECDCDVCHQNGQTSPSGYNYRVAWSHEDREYVGTCSDFPSLSWLDTTQDGALHGIQKLVREVLADMGSPMTRA